MKSNVWSSYSGVKRLDEGVTELQEGMQAGRLHIAVVSQALIVSHPSLCVAQVVLVFETRET